MQVYDYYRRTDTVCWCWGGEIGVGVPVVNYPWCSGVEITHGVGVGVGTGGVGVGTVGVGVVASVLVLVGRCKVLVFGVGVLKIIRDAGDSETSDLRGKRLVRF